MLITYCRVGISGSSPKGEYDLLCHIHLMLAATRSHNVIYTSVAGGYCRTIFDFYNAFN